MHRVYPAVQLPRLARDRRSLATHEAGHSVLFELTGRRVAGATIDSRHAAKGRGGEAWVSDAPDPRHFASQKPLLCLFAAAAYAGRQAECLLHGVYPRGFVAIGDRDDRQAASVLSLAFGTNAPAGGCQELARCMLLAHWHQVQAVAELLLEETTVDGNAIRNAIACSHVCASPVPATVQTNFG